MPTLYFIGKFTECKRLKAKFIDQTNAVQNNVLTKARRRWILCKNPFVNFYLNI